MLIQLLYHFSDNCTNPVFNYIASATVSKMSAKKVGVNLFLLMGTAVATISMATAQSCNSCNCQFNNVQVLSQLIEAKVNSALANEPRKLYTY